MHLDGLNMHLELLLVGVLEKIFGHVTMTNLNVAFGTHYSLLQVWWGTLESLEPKSMHPLVSSFLESAVHVP